MPESKAITVAYGDGIGPEIMEAVLGILREARAKLSIETIQTGESQYKFGSLTGIDSDAWDSLRRTHVLLKAPVTVPSGDEYKPLSDTIREKFSCYAQLRHYASYHPFVPSKHPELDLIVVQVNERNPDDAIRYAFDYAEKCGRAKVTCMSNDDMLHEIFDDIGADYVQVEKEHTLSEISPEQLDVLVTDAPYVLEASHLSASCDIGEHFAMFETTHGSAPDLAGKDLANPSGLLNAAIMMLIHIGQQETAVLIHNAWLATLELGIHTADIYNASSVNNVGTREFADAVIEQLGQAPKIL